MEEGDVVEPDALARARVRGDGRAYGARAQAAAPPPLEGDAGGAAIGLDRGPLLSLEDGLPRKPELPVEVAHVHATPLGEARGRVGAEPAEDFARVGRRRLAAALGRRLAIEENLHRPVL